MGPASIKRRVRLGFSFFFTARSERREALSFVCCHSTGRLRGRLLFLPWSRRKGTLRRGPLAAGRSFDIFDVAPQGGAALFLCRYGGLAW
jgi:hypothetical protein